MFNTGYNGLLGVLILIGDVWAIINIIQSAATNGDQREEGTLGRPGAAATAAGFDPLVFPRPARRQNVSLCRS
jgi:hypothetical protein